MSLSKNGLSMSQAQSISNLCHQRAAEIENKLNNYNVATRKLIIEGKEYVETQGIPVLNECIELLQEKGRLHAVQAFLMSNIRRKDNLLRRLRDQQFDPEQDGIIRPERKEKQEPELLPLLSEVDIWNEMPSREINDFLEAEALAAHIGQFIHKGGKLDTLRKERATLKNLDWIQVEEGKRTPVEVIPANTPEKLMEIHEHLAKLHRQYESKVNYYKAKVKNMLSEKNAEIHRINAIEVGRAHEIDDKNWKKYNEELEIYHCAVAQAREVFEQKRQEDINLVSKLRIEVDPRFKPVIDAFLEAEKGEGGDK